MTRHAAVEKYLRDRAAKGGIGRGKKLSRERLREIALLGVAARLRNAAARKAQS